MRKTLAALAAATVAAFAVTFTGGTAAAHTTKITLESLCKPDVKKGQIKITAEEENGIDFADYTLFRKGGPKFTGRVTVDEPKIHEVPWDSPDDVWKLKVDSKIVAKTKIGDNPLCEKPKDKADFGFAGSCVDEDTAVFGIKNESEADEEFTMMLVGGDETAEGTAKAGEVTLVEVPFSSAEDTWKLEMAGFKYEETVSDEACKTPPTETPPTETATPPETTQAAPGGGLADTGANTPALVGFALALLVAGALALGAGRLGRERL